MKFSDCEIEDGDIRYINKEVRKTLKGYKKSDDRLRIYKGHIMKEYNYQWLKEQSEKEENKIIKELDYHIAMIQMENGEIISGKIYEPDIIDTMEIPLVPNEIEKEEER